MFLVTKWFRMCYFIVLMSSLLFYNAENSTNKVGVSSWLVLYIYYRIKVYNSLQLQSLGTVPTLIQPPFPSQENIIEGFRWNVHTSWHKNSQSNFNRKKLNDRSTTSSFLVIICFNIYLFNNVMYCLGPTQTIPSRYFISISNFHSSHWAFVQNLDVFAPIAPSLGTDCLVLPEEGQTSLPTERMWVLDLCPVVMELGSGPCSLLTQILRNRKNPV
jgi:hypothetical protein